MPDLVRRVVKLDATDTEPVSTVVDPFSGANETTAIKLGAIDDFEEEVETSPDAIARPIDVSRTWQQSYFIREDDSGTADSFVSFCTGQNLEIWVKETYQILEDGGTAPTKLIGAPTTGCTVHTADATVDGMKGTLVTITSTATAEGQNYRDEPTYTTPPT